jgi:hypothetical protein
MTAAHHISVYTANHQFWPSFPPFAKYGGQFLVAGIRLPVDWTQWTATDTIRLVPIISMQPDPIGCYRRLSMDLPALVHQVSRHLLLPLGKGVLHGDAADVVLGLGGRS